MVVFIWDSATIIILRIYVVFANLIGFFVFFEFLFVNTMSDLSPAVFSRDLSASIDILKVYNIIIVDHQLVCARVWYHILNFHFFIRHNNIIIVSLRLFIIIFFNNNNYTYIFRVPIQRMPWQTLGTISDTLEYYVHFTT